MNDQQTINIIKGLIIDGVHHANSGHPGGAMSSLDFAYILFSEYLNFDPNDPKWMGRDRFILSAGHESMLLYSLLHMQGWLEEGDLRAFRQLHSRTPGHPENYMTPGVECTTGPLGQGAAMSVGFAIAAAHFSARLNENLFSYRTWALLGDGCMQEDVTLGAASYAGHLRLNNLIWYYDRNGVQISGNIDRTVSDDYEKIFEGFGWEVISIDGHDHSSLRQALNRATELREKPLLIIGNTTMAKGSHSMEGSAKTHGAPLPAEERIKTKENLGLPTNEDFYCPIEAKNFFRRRFPELKKKVVEWNELLKTLRRNDKFERIYQQCFISEPLDSLPELNWESGTSIATRNAFGEIIAKWAEHLPNLMGGSADLEPSNMTGAFAQIVGDFNFDQREGRNLVFGVREFPMSAICNGLALHGGIIPFDATFLSFSDYARPALRLNAIQRTRVIHEYTHDSFYLGEDGPTHQPVEQLMSLRMIPNFVVMRPADANETYLLTRHALSLKDRPTAICLSRQKLPVLNISEKESLNALKGAYVVYDEENFEVLIMASGGEVSLALEAAKKLDSIRTRVVSMPCWELFEQQDTEYQHKILPPSCKKRVSIEAGVTLGWQKYTGDRGLCIGFDRFGDSAPAQDLAKYYGFEATDIAKRMAQWLDKFDEI